MKSQFCRPRPMAHSSLRPSPLREASWLPPALRAAGPPGGHAGMDDEIAFSPPELLRAFIDALKPAAVGVVAPAVDHAGDADHADAGRHDAVKIVRDHLEDRRTEIADARAPAEHRSIRAVYSCSSAFSGCRCSISAMSFCNGPLSSVASALMPVWCAPRTKSTLPSRSTISTK